MSFRRGVRVCRGFAALASAAGAGLSPEALVMAAMSAPLRRADTPLSPRSAASLRSSGRRIAARFRGAPLSVVVTDVLSFASPAGLVRCIVEEWRQCLF